MSESTIKHIKSGIKKLKRSVEGLEQSQQSIVGKLNSLVDIIEKFDAVNEAFTKKYAEFAEKRRQQIAKASEIISKGMEEIIKKTLNELSKEKLNSFLEYQKLSGQKAELLKATKLKYQQMMEAEKAVGVAFENMRSEQSYINDVLMIKMETSELLNMGGPVVMKLAELKNLLTEAQNEFIKARMQLVSMERDLNDVEMQIFKSTINHLMSACTDLFQRDTILGSLTSLSSTTTKSLMLLMEEYDEIMDTYEEELDKISEEKEIVQNLKCEILNSDDGELLQKVAGMIVNGKCYLKFLERVNECPPIICSTTVTESSDNGKEVVELVTIFVEGSDVSYNVKLKYRLKRKESREKKLILSLVMKMYESSNNPG